MERSGPVTNQTSLCWHYLFFRAVTSQVFSARVSLTAVFGMGTGGPSPQSAPTLFQPLARLKPYSIQKMVTRGRVELPFAA